MKPFEPEHKGFSVVLGWEEDDRPVLGEGLSRTSKPGSRLWDVEVVLANSRPMRTTVRAMSKAEAIKFSRNRYPSAKSITSTGLHK